MVSLEAPDEFLKNRVMNLPESVVAGTHNTEEGEFFPFFVSTFFLQNIQENSVFIAWANFSCCLFCRFDASTC